MNRCDLGCAQTGTGNTVSFVLALLDILAEGRARARMPRSLILEPTRELAAQVADNFELYGKYQKLTMALLIGGVSFRSEEHTSELQSLMRISYAVFCLKKKNNKNNIIQQNTETYSTYTTTQHIQQE